MSKKVKVRSWSLDKFTTAVKGACTRAGVKFNASKVKKAYDGLYSVRGTLDLLSNTK